MTVSGVMINNHSLCSPNDTVCTIIRLLHSEVQSYALHYQDITLSHWGCQKYIVVTNVRYMTVQNLGAVQGQ